MTASYLHIYHSNLLLNGSGKGHCVCANIGSFLPCLICSDAKLLIPVSMLEFVTAPRSVVDIFGSTLLNIVTLNGCCCKILHNNSEFPTRT